MESSEFPCPCCGYLTFTEPPGSYDICPICFWEDDNVQLRYPAGAGGANSPSLFEAQQNFDRFGAMEERFVPNVRSPKPSDRKDPSWRPLDPKRDSMRDFSQPYAEPWPEDSTDLYYWRQGT